MLIRRFLVIILLTLPHLLITNPAKVAFAFDFHDVIVELDWSQVIDYSFKNLHKTALLKSIPTAINNALDGNVKPHNGGIKLLETLLAGSAHQDILIDDFIALANKQRIKPGMLEILQQLKNAGYTLVLASNISEKTLIEISKQAPFKTLLSLFDATLTPTVANNHLAKPMPTYFITLKNRYPDKQIFFVDDSLTNIKAAKRVGLVTHHFKNSQALKKDLLVKGFIS